MKYLAIISLLLPLAACKTGGMGNPGSVLWSMTATDEEQAGYTDDREASARFLCAQDYSNEGYEACVRNSVRE